MLVSSYIHCRFECEQEIYQDEEKIQNIIYSLIDAGEGGRFLRQEERQLVSF